MTAICNILLISCLLVTCQLFLTTAATPVRLCQSAAPLPLMVQLNDCNELPCDIRKGQTANMAVQFVATKNSMMKIKASVQLTTLGMQVPFELITERSNVCQNLLFGAYCPLDKGEDVTYLLMLRLSDQQPELPMRAQVNIVDETDGEVLACFVTNVRVKKH